MSGNRIDRNPQSCCPRTVSGKTLAGGYLPGTFVTEGATTLTQATAHAAGLRLLANRDFYSTGALDANDPLKVAYASGDTGVAYVLAPGQEYQAAVAAATYTYMQELTVGAAGRLTAATTGDKVVAFAKEAGAKSAGDLIDFEVAITYTK